MNKMCHDKAVLSELPHSIVVGTRESVNSVDTKSRELSCSRFVDVMEAKSGGLAGCLLSRKPHSRLSLDGHVLVGGS